MFTYLYLKQHPPAHVGLCISGPIGVVALFPGPIPSILMLHTEKIGEPGDEAKSNPHLVFKAGTFLTLPFAHYFVHVSRYWNSLN